MTTQQPGYYRDLLNQLTEAAAPKPTRQDLFNRWLDQMRRQRVSSQDLHPNLIQMHVINDEGGYQLVIPIANTTVEGCRLIDIAMYISNEEDEPDGDLSLNYELGDDADEDYMMNQFYTDELWLEELHHTLHQAGFSLAAANSVQPSESGMQGLGRASYDAGQIADEVRAAMMNQTKAAP
jgi:hypothetical protein